MQKNLKQLLQEAKGQFIHRSDIEKCFAVSAHEVYSNTLELVLSATEDYITLEEFQMELREMLSVEPSEGRLSNVCD